MLLSLKNKKFPVEVRNFLSDQRKKRSLTLNQFVVSTPVCLIPKKNLKRQILNGNFHDKSSEENYSSSESDVNSEEDCQPEQTSKKNPQMRISVPKFAMACKRVGESYRNVAMLGSSVLEDVGLINEKDQSLVVDLSKVLRERKSIIK